MIILTFCLLLFFVSHFNAALLFKTKNYRSGYFGLFFSERKADFKTLCHTIAMWFFSYKVLDQALRRSCFFWCVSEVFCWIFIPGGMIKAVWLSGQAAWRWPETSPFSQEEKQRVRTSSKVLLRFPCSAGGPITGSSSMCWQTPTDFFPSPAELFRGLRRGAEPGRMFPWPCRGPVKRPGEDSDGDLGDAGWRSRRDVHGPLSQVSVLAEMGRQNGNYEGVMCSVAGGMTWWTGRSQKPDFHGNS